LASNFPDALVRLDLNNPAFQDNLLTLQKTQMLLEVKSIWREQLCGAFKPK